MSAADPRRYYPPPRGRVVEPINPWALRVPLLALAGLSLVFFALVAAIAGYQLMYQDKVLPGVSTVYGVEMTGMTAPEVRSELENRFSYADDAVFVFQYQDQSWEYTAAELGVQLDLDATVDAIFSAGRERSAVGDLWDQWTIYQNGYAVAPILTYNESEAERIIRAIAADIDQPMQDAAITISNGQATASPSQVGLEVDVQPTIDALRQQILALTARAEIPLFVAETPPAIVDATIAAEQANRVLDPRGVTFFIPGELGIAGGPWTATPDSLENMLRIERVNNDDGTAYYDVYVTDEQAREFLRNIAPDLTVEAINARFVFNESTRQLEVIDPGRDGRALDVDATMPGFQTAAFSLEDRTVPLIFRDVPADVNPGMTETELGIVELVTERTTSFRGSTQARLTNVTVAAERFHGLVIAPGSVFSFNQWLGDVSLESGFEEALIIYGDQTITGVGGGVCQVSTTVFQAAFYGGFPILERVPHGYRVSYYEQDGTGPGLDATVYSPIVDFKFRNDTNGHLLIETYVNPVNYTLTFKFYGTDPGRTVTVDGPYIRNVQPAPPPIYRETVGVTRTTQVDYAVSGAEVYVYRDVYDAQGNLIVEAEEFYSNYVPWPAQYQVPPGDPRANR
jgi:vancomycin resistance protein YoaR